MSVAAEEVPDRGKRMERATRSVVSNRIAGRREELGMTQLDLLACLRELGLHLSGSAISQYELGTGLDTSKLILFAIALDCTTTYLSGLTDDPHKWEADEDWETRVTRVYLQGETLSLASDNPKPRRSKLAGSVPIMVGVAGGLFLLSAAGTIG